MNGNVSNHIGGDAFGDVVVAGRDAQMTKIGSVDALGALVEVKRVRRALEALELQPEARDAAAREIAALETELRRPAPDRKRAAGRLEQLIPMLKAAGALASLAHPLGAVAAWLGPFGAAALRALRS